MKSKMLAWLKGEFFGDPPDDRAKKAYRDAKWGWNERRMPTAREQENLHKLYEALREIFKRD